MSKVRWIREALRLYLVVLAISSSGCVSFRRTGQLFLTTRENYSYVSYRSCPEGMFDPIRFFALPFVAVGTVTFAPVYDLVSIPVDLGLKAFGTRILVVGEDGTAIKDADVKFCRERIGETLFTDGCYNTGVCFPLLEKGSVSVAMPGFYPSFASVGKIMEDNPHLNFSAVTVVLQRVEHPIPLFVNRVELRDYERGIGGFDGTTSVLRFDLMKGEWLPPYGNGEVADLSIESRLKITDRERKFRYATRRVEDVLFYELSNAVAIGGADGFVRQFDVGKMAGIKIREADDFDSGSRVVKTLGMRKVIAKNKNWHCEYFSDMARDRCYTFRIRSRRDDKGKLVEAYYGKIYGDFEFEGDDKKGLIGVKFLYYLNPTSLDRNLEWDKKNNLCPTAGKHESQQP